MRFGLLGCGGIGALRAAALTRATGASLAAVCDVDADRARRLAAASGSDAARDWRSLLERRDIDAVVVSTPPHLHAEMAIAALEHGKHVLCEKPLARSSAECRAMLGAAERSGRFLATGFNYRFYPSAQKARELVDEGLIGEIDHVRSYTGYSATDHGQAWLHDAAIMGGGALRDNGIHLIDLTLYFLGGVSEVTGFGSNRVWEFDRCEDNGMAIVRGPHGRLASIHASWTEWRGYRLKVEICGTRGSVAFSCFPMITEITWASERGGKMRRRRHLFPRTFVFEHLKSYRWVVEESFVREFDAFLRATEGRPSSIATGLDGLRAIEVAERAIVSTS